MSDIFAVQDEIAAAIAGCAEAEAQPGARAPDAEPAGLRGVSPIPFVPVAVHARGVAAQPRVSRAGARARSRSSPCRTSAWLITTSRSRRSAGSRRTRRCRGRASWRRARSRSIPDLPEAHAMLGIVAGHYDYDWTEAERRFRLAVKREPLSPHLRQWYGTFFLFAVGRADEALRQLRSRDRRGSAVPDVASDASRISSPASDWRMTLSTTPGRRSSSIPASGSGGRISGCCYAIRGQHTEAMHCAERAMAAAPWSPYSLGLMAAALANQRADRQSRASARHPAR